MPPFFARSFPFTSDAAGVSKSSSFFAVVSGPVPTSWIRRIAASLRLMNARGDKEKSAVDHRDTVNGGNRFLSEPRSSRATASSTASIPSLSRSHSASSSTTYASDGSLCTLRPPTPGQDKCNDIDVITTLKAMQAFVPDSPRTSFIATSPDLEVEEGSYSRRPSYVINQPQLYPYTPSDDDLWAEQMVANILADHYRTKSV